MTSAVSSSVATASKNSTSTMKIDDRKQLILSANQPTNLPQTLIRERSKRSMGGRSSSVVIVSITESDTKTADMKEEDNKSGLEETSLHVSNLSTKTESDGGNGSGSSIPRHSQSNNNKSVAFTSNTMDCSSRRDDNGRTSMKDPSDMGSSLRRSVSFARDTKLDGSERQQQPQGLDDEGSSHDCLGSSHNSMGNGSGRVAMMKAKLRESFSRSSSAFNLMDESWGGALEELDMSSSSEESDDDDDDDSFNNGDDNLGELGNSENFRAMARRQSTSFNMSFRNIGLYDSSQKEGDDNNDDGLDKSAVSLGGSSRRRNTGRGSIFVIADEKFGMTKVVQSRLENAAKKIQRFLRRSLLVLRKYNAEKDYFKNEVKDTEARRQEELADIERFIQDEKEHFRMQLEQEWNANKWTPEEWEAYLQETEDMKNEMLSLREENATFKKDNKQLKRENKQLAIRDPQQEAETARLEKEVARLEKDAGDWTRISGHYTEGIQQAEVKITDLTEKRKIKRYERKKTEKVIAKILKMLEDHPTLAKENPKLIEKVRKLKKQREKKMKKLKAKTVLEEQERIKEKKEQAELKAAEDERVKKQRKERRKSRKQNDDLPDLETLDSKSSSHGDSAELTTKKDGKDKKSKKSSADAKALKRKSSSRNVMDAPPALKALIEEPTTAEKEDKSKALKRGNSSRAVLEGASAKQHSDKSKALKRRSSSRAVMEGPSALRALIEEPTEAETAVKTTSKALKRKSSSRSVLDGPPALRALVEDPAEDADEHDEQTKAEKRSSSKSEPREPSLMALVEEPTEEGEEDVDATKVAQKQSSTDRPQSPVSAVIDKPEDADGTKTEDVRSPSPLMALIDDPSSLEERIEKYNARYEEVVEALES